MNPKDQISVPEWMGLKVETKMALAAIFGLSKTGFSQTVTDAQGHPNFITDGYTHKDLSVITFDRLLTYLGQADENDNVHTLFLKAIEKIEAPMVPLEKFENIIKGEGVKEIELQEGINNKSIDAVKCAKCKFRTSSNKIMREHFKNFHKDYN